MSFPMVSVIMGTYNDKDTVRKAIHSIQEQTYKNWELIICDDHSTDDTYEVLKEIQKDNPEKIILLRNNENMKLAFSLNRCLSVAKGKYIARMDADDISLPHRLETQVNFLETHSEYQVVSCRSVVFDENGEREVIGIEGEPLKECMLFNVPFVHPTIMMRKSVYDEIGGYTVLPRTERGQDVDLWFKFFSKGFRGYILPDVLYKYYNLRSTLKKRKNLRLAFNYTKTNLVGYHLLKFPKYKYIFAFKPVVSTLVPEKIKIIYRNNK